LNFSLQPQQEIDSLINKLKTAEDSQKGLLYYQLSSAYTKYDLDKAIEITLEGINVVRKLEDRKYYAFLTYQIGYSYFLKANVEKALSFLFEASKIAGQYSIKDASIDINYLIGYIYRDLKNFKTSLEYFKKLIEISKEEEDFKTLVLSMNEVGNIYMLMGKMDSSLIIKKNALKIAEQKNDLFGISCCAHDIGLVYEELNQPKLALPYLIKSFKIDFNGNKNREAAITSMSLSRVYAMMKDYSNAVYFGLSSLELSKNSGLYKEIVEAHLNLAGIYSKTNDYKNAYEHLYKAYNLKDSINNEISSSKLAEMQTKYETEKKESEILRLKEERENQNKLNNLLILISILVVLIAIIIYRQFHLKKGTNKLLTEKNIQLEEVNNKLYELNATKDKFFSIISHDLKNPFVSLLGLSEILVEDFNRLTDESKLELILDINKSAMNSHQLLENLLFWSGAQTGKIQTYKQELNIYEIIKEVISLIQPSAKMKDIELVHNINVVNKVFADKFMITTVIRNLITNAIKFTNINGKVEVYVNQRDHHVQFEVIDDGVGMSEEDMNKLFKIDSDFKTKGTKNEKGTGLGLILCKEFIEKNNGQIWVESQKGVGSKFIFTLPIST
jgi:signal transduction histidine kinase